MVQFPAPIGGTVLLDDFAPSILFAILYALLSPLMLYRMFHRRSRCTLLIGTAIFSIERIVIFSLRAVQSKNDSFRFSGGLTSYMQISFGMGFIGIASDAVKLARCLLVNATYGPEKYFQSPAAATKEGLVPPPTADTPDQPRVRTWCRRVANLMGLAFLTAIILEAIANSNYSKVFNSQKDANMTAVLRVASSAVAVALSCVVVCMTLWGLLKLPRVGKWGVAIIGTTYTLVVIIGIYRLSVMGNRTTSLSAPDALNTPRAKAAFYILHVLPEWLASVILFGNNIRKSFGTGLTGDWRYQDETEKQRVKRLEKEAKKEAKRDAKRQEENINLANTEDVEMKGS